MTECSNLIGDLDQEGGDPLGGVVVVRHVVDHLDDVDDAHEGLLHVLGVLEVDRVRGLLDRAQELGVVRGLDVVLGDPLVDVVPNLFFAR